MALSDEKIMKNDDDNDEKSLVSWLITIMITLKHQAIILTELLMQVVIINKADPWLQLVSRLWLFSSSTKHSRYGGYVLTGLVSGSKGIGGCRCLVKVCK